MVFELSVAAGAAVVGAVMLIRARRRNNRRVIDGGLVSRNWLAEHKLGKRDSWP